MVHGVAALIQRHLPVYCPVRFCHRRDGVGVPRQAHKVGIEVRQIVLEYLRSVALGIDRDEERTRAIRNGTELVKDLRNLEQRGRTDFRAMSEAEEDQERPSL